MRLDYLGWVIQYIVHVRFINDEIVFDVWGKAYLRFIKTKWFLTFMRMRTLSRMAAVFIARFPHIATVKERVNSLPGPKRLFLFFFFIL